MPLAALLEQVPEAAAFIGDAVGRYRAEILAARPRAVFPDRSLFLAGTVARLGEASWRQGGASPRRSCGRSTCATRASGSRAVTLPPFALEAATDDDVPALMVLERACFSHPWTARNFRGAMADPERGLMLLLRRPAPADEPGAASWRTAASRTWPTRCTSTTSPWTRLAGAGPGPQAAGAVAGWGRAAGPSAPSSRCARATGPPSASTGPRVSRAWPCVAGYYTHPAEDALILEKRDLSAAARGPA